MCGGTRRWSSVPQITIGADHSAPSTSAATTSCHTAVATPITTKGSAPSPHIRFITVR